MLLSTAKNPPSKSGDVLYMQDLICIYFDLKTNWSMFYINGTVRGFKSLEEFKTEIGGITEEIREKNRSGKKLKAVVFINDLDVVKMILPDGQASNATKSKNGVRYMLEFETDSFQFRNFNIIFNNRTQRIQKLYPDLPICVGMAEFIKSLGLPLKHCRYSLAYVSKRIFYADIKSELWEDTKQNHRMIRDLQTWQDMQAGNQGGALSSFSGASDIRFDILYDIGSYDKKSAYPSYFIRDRFFPVGKITRIIGNASYRLRILRGLIGRRAWFKIVINCAGAIDELALFRTASKTDVFEYGVEFWDYYTLKDCGIDIFNILTLQGVTFRLYATEKTGYMPDCFRRKIIDLYNKKNALPKNSAERFMIKTQLDMIYGKGLQKYDFKTDRDVIRKYTLRGENFLSPAMSMHVVAGVRHEVLKISARFAGDCIAIDTDGVKIDLYTAGEETVSEFFEAVNDFILDANRAAGFDSDIGIWDHEYTAERFIQFAPKVYAYQEQDELPVCKFAGISERHLLKYLQQLDGDPFEIWNRDGIHAKTCNGWHYLTDIGFLENVIDYTIERNDEK